MNTGKKIRQIRLTKGYSQENLADMLGISTTAYGDIERNKTELTISRASEIAKTLNISILDLLDIEELVHLTEASVAPTLSLKEMALESVEKLHLENEKLKAEAEKWQIAAAYWREKYENRFIGNVLRIVTEEPERRKIGF
jgi:XRE family transcriptional regulator, regulator of sulfur utilization